MKKYIKPNIEMLAVEAMSQLLADSGLEIHNEMGDGTTGQLAPGKKGWGNDDEDDGDYGW